METKTIQTQLLEFQKKVAVIKKDAKNPHFKNTYATLTQILSEVKPLLTECGVLLTQPILNNEVHTTLCLGADCITASIPLPTNLNPQQLGSAITYFRRYTLASLLALEIDDDDANDTMNAKPVKLEVMSDKVFNAMVKAIADGKSADVVKAMPKYEMLKEQKDELHKLIKLAAI